MALAFFITARTEPIQPNPNAFGSMTSIILYDAPSQEVAVQWANTYVKELLLDDHPEQQLKTLDVLPFHDRLLTSEGEENIDWASVAERANASGSPKAERGSSMMFMPANANRSQTATGTGIDDLEEYRKKIPNAERYNWNPKKQFYYVLYHGTRAYLAKAMNMFFASRPYMRSFQGTPEGEHKVFLSAFPGVKRFRDESVN